jgi:putative transposase
MARSYVSSNFHCVWSTAERYPFICPDLCDRLWPYLGGIARQNNMTARCIGGRPDRVHILLSIPATMPIAKAVQLIKGGSSKWVRDNAGEWGQPMWGKFEWQEGYAAFSTSASVISSVASYIQGQEEHHRVRTFEEEYIALLEKHGIVYDRRYVFG